MFPATTIPICSVRLADGSQNPISVCFLTKVCFLKAAIHRKLRLKGCKFWRPVSIQRKLCLFVLAKTLYLVSRKTFSLNISVARFELRTARSSKLADGRLAMATAQVLFHVIGACRECWYSLNYEFRQQEPATFLHNKRWRLFHYQGPKRKLVPLRIQTCIELSKSSSGKFPRG